MFGSGNWSNWIGDFAGIASQAYNASLNADIEQARFRSQERIAVANASAVAAQGEQNRALMNNVLLGVGALLALMVVKKALT